MNERIRELIGLKKSALSLIESGRNAVTPQVVKSICREFNVNEEWLRDGTGEMFAIPEDETAAIVSDLLESRNNQFYDLILDIVKTYQTLSPMDQDIIKKFCQQLAETQKNRKD